MLLRPRPAVRAVLVDHAYRLLLLHVTDGRTAWWEAPGDTQARGETPSDALLRALRDEAGVAGGVRPGPCVWTLREGRTETRWHVAWLDDPTAPGAAPVTDTTLGARWWTLDELATSDETFRPPHLPALAPVVVRGDYGADPADVAEGGGLRYDDELACTIFVRCAPGDAAGALRPLAGAPVGSRARFFWRGLDVEVTRNGGGGGAGADYTRWSSMAWVRAVAGTPRADAVASVAAILRAFWRRGIDAVAACDYERDLPYAGGRDRPLGQPSV